MLLIEGPDSVGKSTLAQNLQKLDWFQASGYITAHFSRPPLGFDARHYVPRMSTRVIQDRFHVSEPVYAKIRQDTPCISSQEFENLNLIIKSFGGFSCLVTMDPCRYEAWMKNNDREQMYNLEQNLRVNEIFLQLARDRALNVGGHVFRWKPDFHIHIMHGYWPEEFQMADLAARYIAHAEQTIKKDLDFREHHQRVREAFSLLPPTGGRSDNSRQLNLDFSDRV